jgi:adenylate kinase
MNASLRTVLFAGPNGVGKSTVIRALTERMPHSEHLAGSATLMRWCGVDSYAGLAALSDEFKARKACEGMEQLLTQLDSEPGPVILIDAHMLYFNRGQVSSCTHDWMRRVGAVVSVTASPSVVMRRIVADELAGRRKRHMFTPGISDDARMRELRRFLRMARDHSLATATEWDLPALVVTNSTSSPDRAAAEIAAFLEPLIRRAPTPVGLIPTPAVPVSGPVQVVPIAV